MFEKSKIFINVCAFMVVSLLTFTHGYGVAVRDQRGVDQGVSLFIQYYESAASIPLFEDALTLCEAPEIVRAFYDRVVVCRIRFTSNSMDKQIKIHRDTWLKKEPHDKTLKDFLFPLLGDVRDIVMPLVPVSLLVTPDGWFRPSRRFEEGLYVVSEFVLEPDTSCDIILFLSKEKLSDFKEWLDGTQIYYSSKILIPVERRSERIFLNG
jgi:hypothetical protein